MISWEISRSDPGSIPWPGDAAAALRREHPGALRLYAAPLPGRNVPSAAGLPGGAILCQKRNK